MILGPPTLGGFIVFVRTVMGISTTVLPDDSLVLPMAFTVALEIVNLQLQAASSVIYTLAVYNLAGSNVINFAPDLPGAAIYKNGMPFFEYVRDKWEVNDFVSGVVQSTGDEGTSVSLVVPEVMKDFTLANLQQLKDPYGRRYLGFAQSVGTNWGLT